MVVCESYESRVKYQRWVLNWIKKHECSRRSITQFWHLMWGSKRNQVRQPADIDADKDSHKRTKMKDPNSEEGDRHKYQMNLFADGSITKGLMHCWTMRIIIEGVDDTMTQMTGHNEEGEAWVAGHYSATFKFSSSHYQFYWVIDTVSSCSICISAFRVILREIIVVHITYCPN